MSKPRYQSARKAQARAVKAIHLTRFRKQSKIPQLVSQTEKSLATFEVGDYSYFKRIKSIIVKHASDQVTLCDNVIVYKNYDDVERVNADKARLQSIKLGDPVFISDNTLQTRRFFMDQLGNMDQSNGSVFKQCGYMGIFQNATSKKNLKMANIEVDITTCLYGTCFVTKTFVTLKGLVVYLKGTYIIVGTLVKDHKDMYEVFVGNL